VDSDVYTPKKSTFAPSDVDWDAIIEDIVTINNILKE
jgi:hypothetical protein